MSQPRVLPYGEWPSPINVADLARGTLVLHFPGFAKTPHGEQVWWVEVRPEADGRYALVARTGDGTDVDVLGPQWSPRSRIIEYGARPWVFVPGVGTVFSFWDDQRLYLLREGSTQPHPLTVAPTDELTHMYGEPVAAPDGEHVWVVRESHWTGDVTDIERAIVSVPLDGSAATTDAGVGILAAGHRFFGYPRPSADGQRIAYIAWDHPQMPWDGTLLYVADVAEGEGSNARVIAGSTSESVLQPEWADADHLYAISDRTGWWNLYRFGVDDGTATPLCPRDEEFAQPLWQLGYTTYGVMSDGQLAVLHGVGEQRLSRLDPTTGELHPVVTDLDFSEELQVSGTRIVAGAGGPATRTGMVTVDLATAERDTLKYASSVEVDPAYLPEAFPLTVDGPDGPVHAWVYPPRNPDVVAPEGELPPYLAMVHGGPTGHVTPRLSLGKALYTSHGIGVIDINYGGSSGYGRAYRERLRERWGIVDVQDTVAAMRGLCEQGLADPARLGIVGGSAGGWTTLASLVFADTFACGAAYFPVTDLLPFAESTHDFESRYLDGLIGELPAHRDRYIERSPLTHLDKLHVPVLLLQGDDDKVVPPEQPASVARALASKGIPHRYLLFAGEQHGFRKAENMIAALEAELSFYGQVFGYEAPDVPFLELTR